MDNPWLLMVHNIPPKPAYLRTKIARRLQGLGAVPVKNSVYVLPRSEEAVEDLEWVAREIVEGGGAASLCEASFVHGLDDAQLEALFRAAREPDYARIAADARALLEALPKPAASDAEAAVALERQLARLRTGFEAIQRIDFFGAAGRETAERALSSVGNWLAEARMPQKQKETAPAAVGTGAAPRGMVWVTRRGIHVDRIASGWLIRRFIDPAARFKFVPARSHRAEAGELRFDMFEAEYTHEGERSTFEVLLARFALADPALAAIGEVVHDIDLKDEKYGRPETPGIASLIGGITMAHAADEDRLERGGAILDDLYQYFRRMRRGRKET